MLHGWLMVTARFNRSGRWQKENVCVPVYLELYDEHGIEWYFFSFGRYADTQRN